MTRVEVDYWPNVQTADQEVESLTVDAPHVAESRAVDVAIALVPEMGAVKQLEVVER